MYTIIGKIKSIALTCAITAVTIYGGTANAATQGTLGATSTGTVVITASVPNRVRITGLADVAFTSQDPNTAATNPQNVCVWSNTSTKGYTVTATGSGSANAFTLANAALTVPYSVQWAASSGQTTGTALTAGTASVNLVSAATEQTCASGATSSASLITNISTTALGTMQAQTTYTGTLTLVVAPM